MLTAIQHTVSHLFRFFGPYIISSEEGAQQGDPIGPFCFVTPSVHCCCFAPHSVITVNTQPNWPLELSQVRRCDHGMRHAHLSVVTFWSIRAEDVICL